MRNKKRKLILYKRDYFMFGMFLTIVILYGIQAVLSFNHTTDGSQELSPILVELAEVKKQNALLHVAILEKSSLHEIKDNAEKMGFRQAERNDYHILR